MERWKCHRVVRRRRRSRRQIFIQFCYARPSTNRDKAKSNVRPRTSRLCGQRFASRTDPRHRINHLDLSSSFHLSAIGSHSVCLLNATARRRSETRNCLRFRSSVVREAISHRRFKTAARGALDRKMMFSETWRVFGPLNGTPGWFYTESRLLRLYPRNH